MKPKKTATDRIMICLFNALSILLPLSLLAAFLFLLQPRAVAYDTPLCCTVRLRGMPEEYLCGLAEGDPVMDAVGKRPLGRVLSYEAVPAMTERYSQNSGKMRKVTVPGHADLTVTVEMRGYAVPGGYRVGGYLLHRGKEMPLRLPHLVFTGVCTDITPLPFG